MRTFLNRSLWISLYLLFPVTLVGLISQNAIPGEFLYPVKLGMENVGTFVFSLTPEAKASYDSTLTQRRFEEAQKLITYEANTSGLDTLVVQTAKTQESVNNIENPKQKEELREKLIQNINVYQEKLTQTQQKVDPAYIPPTPTATPTISPPSIPTTRIRIAPTNVFVNPYDNKTIVTPISTPTPSPTPIPIPLTPQKPPEIIKEIEETKEKLEEIKHQIQNSPIFPDVPTAAGPTGEPTKPVEDSPATLTPTATQTPTVAPIQTSPTLPHTEPTPTTSKYQNAWKKLKYKNN